MIPECTVTPERPATPADPPVAVTIAGSDSGGGAGIQADLLTFAAHRVHGTTVVTAITAQNTLGVTASLSIPPSLITAQLTAVTTDFDVRAAKTGMLGGRDQLVAVAAAALPRLVVDPVLVATSGAVLYDGDPTDYLRILAPRAFALTPNLPEARLLLGHPLTSRGDRIAALRELADHGPSLIVLKGGHDDGPNAVDLCYLAGRVVELSRPRVPTGNTHGTGCTFAAAITARLAHGDPPEAALEAAKSYVTAGLLAAADQRLGAGSGPLDHFPTHHVP
ncbi:hydroxymethylpyrimidine/phosphomethylpyrimidine kinase [Stackebrandtia endophytica]|uniref:Hydroxymethylpyrimidine/phosphomethylpyrimidine kinase n=1 Tax=Stackebrandtia endophytica TaxID=1496996 RepID=A0A543B0A4_9ACTN|nr:hydroxymethylpyrimidine/phosphomethylpyrimidine kinase [Stackebrandtia endophytica]